MANPNQPWLDEQSVNDPRQVDADQNNRLRHHYMSLDDIGEQLFFLTGGAFDAYVHVNGEFVNEKKDIYTPAEKNAFRQCAIDFFNPHKPDGSLDFDEFERRVDEYAASIAELHKGQMEFFNNDENFTGIMDSGKPVTNFEKEHLTQLMSPDSMVRHAMQSLYDSISDYMNDELMGDYVSRKTEKGIIGEEEHHSVTIDGVFNKSIATMVRNAAGITDVNDEYFKKFYRYDAKAEKSFTKNLSDDEKKRINDKANPEKIRIGELAKNNKIWMEPEIDISLKALENLDNLSGQLKDADHWYHRDSKEFKQFKAALKEAHDKYEQYKGLGRELTDAEKKELIPLFDKVADTADRYLTGKENRDRVTGLGAERYDIAFSALHVTSYGKAREKMMIHNFFKAKRGSKELTIKDLEDRAGRTSEQQQAHKKAQKEAAKQKNSTLKSDPPAMGK